VFVCRLWRSWVKKKVFINRPSTPRSKDKYFITRTAFLSVELNAHNLLYLILLVQQKQLPKESLHIYLFNSQPCEGMFRNARSLSGVYSTVVNFTTHDFLRRAAKLSLLNQIKCHELTNQSSARISFPVHHKHKNDYNLSTIQHLDDVDHIDINEVILESYDASIKLIENLGITSLLKKHKIYKLEKLSKFIFNDLNSNSKVRDDSTGTINDDNNYDNSNSASQDCRSENNDDDDSDNNDTDEDSESDDDEVPGYDDEEVPGSGEDEDSGSDDDEDPGSGDDEDPGSDDDEDPDDDDDDGNAERIQSTKTSFSGIRIKDKIKPDLVNSYFEVKINDTTKYLHKQSAVWLLTDKNDRLSSDRLSRVMGVGKIQ
jgi:hypothetical protein